MRILSPNPAWSAPSTCRPPCPASSPSGRADDLPALLENLDREEVGLKRLVQQEWPLTGPWGDPRTQRPSRGPWLSLHTGTPCSSDASLPLPFTFLQGALLQLGSRGHPSYSLDPICLVLVSSYVGLSFRTEPFSFASDSL